MVEGENYSDYIIGYYVINYKISNYIIYYIIHGWKVDIIPFKLEIRLVRDTWTIHIRPDQIICVQNWWFSQNNVSGIWISLCRTSSSLPSWIPKLLDFVPLLISIPNAWTGLKLFESMILDVDVLTSPDLDQVVFFWPCLNIRAGQEHLVSAPIFRPVIPPQSIKWQINWLISKQSDKLIRVA